MESPLAMVPVVQANTSDLKLSHSFSRAGWTPDTFLTWTVRSSWLAFPVGADETSHVPLVACAWEDDLGVGIVCAARGSLSPWMHDSLSLVSRGKTSRALNSNYGVCLLLHHSRGPSLSSPSQNFRIFFFISLNPCTWLSGMSNVGGLYEGGH